MHDYLTLLIEGGSSTLRISQDTRRRKLAVGDHADLPVSQPRHMCELAPRARWFRLISAGLRPLRRTRLVLWESVKKMRQDIRRALWRDGAARRGARQTPFVRIRHPLERYSKEGCFSLSRRQPAAHSGWRRRKFRLTLGQLRADGWTDRHVERIRDRSRPASQPG